MSVIRIEKTKDYSVMSNYHLRDKNISLKTKGLLSLMLSLPDEWDYSVEGLVFLCKENETAIKTALDELKEFGYLEVIKKKPNETKSGRFEYEYIVYEKPKQEGKKQDLEILPLEIQPLENPCLDNKENTNIINTNKLNIKDNNKEIKEIKERQFEEFWRTYPKKVNKQGSYKAFLNIPHLDKVFDTIIRDVEKRKTSNEWKDYQFIPHPTTYIHQKRWEDEETPKLWWETDEFKKEQQEKEKELKKYLEKTEKNILTKNK